MTIRTAASGVIKLLGLYFAADATIGIFSSVAFLVVPRPQGVMTGVQYAFGAALGGWIGAAFVAAFFIFRGDDIARLVFEEQLLPAPTVAADDLLRIGISLLGVGIAASGVPTLARAAATALWNIGASRQAGFADAMRRFYPSPVEPVLSLMVGIALVRWAGPLSAMLKKGSSNPEV